MVWTDETDVVFADDRLRLGGADSCRIDGWLTAMSLHVAAAIVRTTRLTIRAADRLRSDGKR